MPLHPNGKALILAQLESIANGERVGIIEIGCLTDEQHRLILEYRRSQGLAGGESPIVVYLGRHHYQSRFAQKYTIEDMAEQAEAGLAENATPLLGRSMTALRAAGERDDGYGKRVRDQAVLELSARKPRIELYSVIPKGDGR